jgi:hypothetical protein
MLKARPQLIGPLPADGPRPRDTYRAHRLAEDGALDATSHRLDLG